jgi:hypothetical protein
MRPHGKIAWGSPSTGRASVGVALPRALKKRAQRQLEAYANASFQADEVYVVRLPLVGFEMVDMLPEGLSSVGALHLAVIVATQEINTNGYWMFDFLPIEPLKQETILNILAGRSVKAQTRSRVLKSAPTKRCKLIGPSVHVDTIKVAKSFQKDWPKFLSLGKRDCRHHATTLVKELTGVNIREHMV